MRPHPGRVGRAVRHLRRRDPVLAQIIGRVGRCTWETERAGSAFSALIEAMLYQQITGKAAASIHRRLRKVLGRRHPRPQEILGAPVRALRGAGLSRQKISYMRDLAARAANGLPLRGLGRREDDAVVEALCAVKGVGRWTAEMFLIFRLGRFDVLPVDDYGVRKAAQLAYGLKELPDARWLKERGEAWRPYRTVASWYLWRSLELSRAPVPAKDVR
jgi:3-methyladenine DNA glycosylase/8-oxoguanine DNA glycosylase